MPDLSPEDQRLVAYGWAPGGYWCVCDVCLIAHDADKRAWRCRACAVKAADAWDAMTPEQRSAEIARRHVAGGYPPYRPMTATADPNFAHCVRLCGVGLWGIGTIGPGRDGPHIATIPAEVLKALLEREVETEGPLADPAREALAHYEQFQGAFSGQGESD